MVAYNFQAMFAHSVSSGSKCQTIRKKGKRRHAMYGELLQLYTGQRTQECRKLVSPDPMCNRSRPIHMWIGTDRIIGIYVDNREVKDIESFAHRDGFLSASSMHRWFKKTHGVGLFSGVLIEWEWLHKRRGEYPGSEVQDG